MYNFMDLDRGSFAAVFFPACSRCAPPGFFLDFTPIFLKNAEFSVNISVIFPSTPPSSPCFRPITLAREQKF